MIEQEKHKYWIKHNDLMREIGGAIWLYADKKNKVNIRKHWDDILAHIIHVLYKEGVLK